jgi:hypothetical protein
LDSPNISPLLRFPLIQKKTPDKSPSQISDEGGAEMTSRRRLHSAPAAPLDGEDILCQILV